MGNTKLGAAATSMNHVLQHYWAEIPLNAQ
jgi:hypothetical protein